MTEKLIELNRKLRAAVLVIGTIVLIFKLTDNKKPDDRQSEDGYQTREFDDIW